MLGKSFLDNPGALSADIIPDGAGTRNLGTEALPFNNIYANNVIGAVLSGDSLASADGLSSLAVGNSATTVALKTGATLVTKVNNVTKLTLSATAFDLASGVIPTAQEYDLLDGSDKNHYVTSFASGTAYNLTNSSAQLTFGTSNAAVTLDKAGTYLITSRANLEYSGATFASNRTVTLKLRRTNNTPADLTGATTALGTNVTSTATGVMAAVNIPAVIYTTANTNDIVTIFGDVSVAPSAGNLQATEANIVAIRLTA